MCYGRYTENPHRRGNGVWRHCLLKSGLEFSRAVTMVEISMDNEGSKMECSRVRV